MANNKNNSYPFPEKSELLRIKFTRKGVNKGEYY